MLKRLIWPSEALPNHDQSVQLIPALPEYVVIVVMQQVDAAIAASVSEVMSAGAAQSLCKALLESATQLACADQAQRICEDHGAVFTNAVSRPFSVAEGIYFYGEDFLIEQYSATGHWIESRLGELDSVCLDFVEAIASKPFAVCVCYG
jgi:hypothetical protein